MTNMVFEEKNTIVSFKHKVGNYYKNSNSIYILCDLEHGRAGLMDLESATLWTSPRDVEDIYDITADEFMEINEMFYDFEYVENIKIQEV